MSRPVRILAAALASMALAAGLAAPAPAAAQFIAIGDSPRWGSLQLSVSAYRPDIDSEFNGTAAPYAAIFGTSRPLMFQLLFDRSLWMTEVGTLDIGFGAGYWQVWGLGIAPNGARGDSTTLMVIPLTLAVGYRVDVFYDKWHVPFEPYARLALVDYLWWASTAGQVSTAPNGSGQAVRGQGGTFGWSATLGIALVLDFFDPTLARQMDQDTGINRTLLFFEVSTSSVDDFGSKKSWQLGPGYYMWGAGLQFVF